MFSFYCSFVYKYLLNFNIFVFNFLGAKHNEVKNYIYISGGKTDEEKFEKCIFKMDTNIGKWDQFKLMGIVRCGHQSFIKNDQMYLIGGYKGSDYAESAENEVVSLNKDLPNKSFSFMNNKRLSFGMCYFAECVFVGGGYQNECKALDKCEIYSFETCEWTEVSSMNTKRFQLTLTYFQEKIWAVGGFNNSNGTYTWLDTIETFDITQNKWTTSHLKLLTKRCGHRAVAYDEKLFVIGGDSEEHVISSVEVYSSKTNQFSFVAAMNIPRFNFGCCIVDSRLYVIGGSFNSDGSPTDTVEIYDFEKNKWKSGPSLPMKLHDFACTNTF